MPEKCVSYIDMCVCMYLCLWTFFFHSHQQKNIVKIKFFVPPIHGRKKIVVFILQKQKIMTK